ncbi:MAG: hypothetical protein HY280_03255 [Nitrospinae bacterium]|nr:hypothetical protein [Nitrospinota bacterium]
MTKTFKIALIGPGQIGSRYLQGLAGLGIGASIEVVGRSEGAINTALSRFKEIVGSEAMELVVRDGVSGLSDELDLAIVATNADVRSNLVRELAEKKGVKNLILEKVVFQKKSDFEDVGKLLERKNIRAWVNHPRRLYPVYKKIKTALKGTGPIELKVAGGSWGMACNGLHFLDLLAYLTDCEGLVVSNGGLDKKILESKRPGFKEVSGELSGSLGANGFSFYCGEVISPVEITITSAEVALKIREADNTYEIATRVGKWVWVRHNARFDYLQSETTSSVVEGILLDGRCDLPTLREARMLHEPFLDSLTEHFNRYGSARYDACPIT